MARSSLLSLLLVLAASPEGLGQPVARVTSSGSIGASLNFELLNPATCTVLDDSGAPVEATELASVGVQQSNAMVSYDLSTVAPGVLVSFDYWNPCDPAYSILISGVGATDRTEWPPPGDEWAAQYITFEGAVDEGRGRDGELAWTRVDHASFPATLVSHGCNVLVTIELGSSAVGELERWVGNYTTDEDPGLTRSHGRGEQRAAAASATMTFAPLDPGCPVPPDLTLVAKPYAPWGDVASLIYRADWTDVAVRPVGIK